MFLEHVQLLTSRPQWQWIRSLALEPTALDLQQHNVHLPLLLVLTRSPALVHTVLELLHQDRRLPLCLALLTPLLAAARTLHPRAQQ